MSLPDVAANERRHHYQRSERDLYIYIAVLLYPIADRNAKSAANYLTTVCSCFEQYANIVLSTKQRVVFWSITLQSILSRNSVY
jgi:hypothetical protein